MEIKRLILVTGILSLAACTSLSSGTGGDSQAGNSEERRQKVLHEMCDDDAREVGGKTRKELRTAKGVLEDERNDTNQTLRLKRVCHKLTQANSSGMTSEEEHAMLERECKMSVDDNTRSMDPRQVESAAKMKRLCDELTVHKP